MIMANASAKVRISVTIMPALNTMLEEASSKSKISKSELVEKSLKLYFRGQLESDLKKLSKMKFYDLPPEDDWLKIAPKNTL